MASLDPTVLIDSLLAMRKAVRVLCTYWRCVLPVFIGAYLLHLAQTTLLLKLASPRVNLDSIPIYVYAIEDNSTAPTAEGLVAMAVAVAVKTSGMEISPLWKLHFVGDLLWMLSMTVIALSFTNASREALERRPRTREEQRRQGIATSTWRKCKSLAFALVIWDAVGWVVGQILDEEGELAYFFDGLVNNVYLVAVMVIEEEGLSGRRAIQKACTLVGRRIKKAPIYYCTSLLVLDALRFVCFVTFSEVHEKEPGPPAIREDTTTEIFRFSLVSAFVAASVQSVVCIEATTFYNKSNEPRQGNTAEAETPSTTSAASSGNQDVYKLEEEKPEEEEKLKEERAGAEEATSSSPGQAHKAIGVHAEDAKSSPGRARKAMGGAAGQRPKRLRRPNSKYFGPDWSK